MDFTIKLIISIAIIISSIIGFYCGFASAISIEVYKKLLIYTILCEALSIIGIIYLIKNARKHIQILLTIVILIDIYTLYQAIERFIK